jgi:hypothetical protein
MYDFILHSVDETNIEDLCFLSAFSTKPTSLLVLAKLKLNIYCNRMLSYKFLKNTLSHWF